jgi:hypothetical protein
MWLVGFSIRLELLEIEEERRSEVTSGDPTFEIAREIHDFFETGPVLIVPRLA